MPLKAELVEELPSPLTHLIRELPPVEASPYTDIGPLKMKKAPPAIIVKPTAWFNVSGSFRYMTESIAKTTSVITSWIVLSSAAE